MPMHSSARSVGVLVWWRDSKKLNCEFYSFRRTRASPPLSSSSSPQSVFWPTVADACHYLVVVNSKAYVPNVARTIVSCGRTICPVANVRIICPVTAGCSRRRAPHRSASHRTAPAQQTYHLQACAGIPVCRRQPGEA